MKNAQKLITNVRSGRLEDATLQVRKSIVTRVVIISELEAPSSKYNISWRTVL